MNAPRYAIYFVPPAEGALYRFGSSVLGYDCYTGEPRAIEGADTDWPDTTREPRMYGFHATLKPPFALADGYSRELLIRAVNDFAAGRKPVFIGEMAVRELGSFLALVPTAVQLPIRDLADACVRAFDRFRAPMSELERQRRLTPGLTDRQIINLAEWGYPYVFEDFRFHMTLTISLPAQKRDRALQFLRRKYEEACGPAAVTLDQIVISEQIEAKSPFRVVAIATLG